jgi:hypothetical protein
MQNEIEYEFWVAERRQFADAFRFSFLAAYSGYFGIVQLFTNFLFQALGFHLAAGQWWQ